MSVDADETLAMVLTFMEITGCEDQTSAENYVSMGAHNIEAALNLFFESGGSLGAAQSTAGVASQTNGLGSPARADAGGGQLTDEELARELQEAIYKEADDIRVADSGYQDTLVGYHDLAQNEMNRATHFTGFSAGSDQDDTRGLCAMFAPPSYRFEGNLEEAKATAVGTQKLLLISFNEKSDFRSHVLNRDVWKKEEIEILMNAFFVLLQVEAKPGEGMAALYKVTEVPSIIVVDPRTGRKLKTIIFEEFRSEEKARDTLLSFIGEFPTEQFYPCEPEVANEHVPDQTPQNVQPQNPSQPPTPQPPDQPIVTPAPSGVTLGSTSATPSEVDAETVALASETKKVYSNANSTLADLHAARRRRMEGK